MNALSHEQAAELLHEATPYLSAEQRAALAAHLAECEQCRAYADQLRALQPRLSQALRARHYAHAPEASATTRAILQTTRRSVMRKQLTAILGIATVAVIAIIAVSSTRGPSQSLPGVQSAMTRTPTIVSSPTPAKPPSATPPPSPLLSPGLDRFEPNNDFEQATPITVNVKYDRLNFAMLTPSADGWDSDYFKVPVKPGMSITCRTSDLSVGTDTNLILYDEGRNGLEGNDNADPATSDKSSSVTYAVTYEGWLYALVGEGFSRGLLEAQQATYSLECVTFTALTTSPDSPPSSDNSKIFMLPWMAGVSHCVVQNHRVQGNGAGLDFDLKDEAVLAPQDGIVAYAGWNSEGGGNTIIISHTGGIASTYMHLSQLMVAQGEQVEQGQRLGVSGDIGQATGPLLHFHVMENGRPIEPIFVEAGHPLKEGDCIASQNTRPLASDRFEPNNDFDQATPIGLNTKYDRLNFAMLPPNTTGQDSDYFKVSVKAGVLITCRTFELSAGTDTNLILYDINRNGIAGQDDVDRAAGDLSSSVTYATTYEGWLYVLVGEGFSRSPEEAQQATYSLECSTSK